MWHRRVRPPSAASRAAAAAAAVAPTTPPDARADAAKATARAMPTEARPVSSSFTPRRPFRCRTARRRRRRCHSNSSSSSNNNNNRGWRLIGCPSCVRQYAAPLSRGATSPLERFPPPLPLTVHSISVSNSSHCLLIYSASLRWTELKLERKKIAVGRQYSFYFSYIFIFSCLMCMCCLFVA